MTVTLPLACLEKYFIKASQNLLSWCKIIEIYLIPPMLEQSKLCAPSISLVILKSGDLKKRQLLHLANLQPFLVIFLPTT